MKYIDPLSYPIHVYPLAFIDYIWVITLYVTFSFCFAVLIDGYLLPPFNYDRESNYSSVYLFTMILLQLAGQGFIVILISSLLQRLPSPMTPFGYDTRSSLGSLVRNPAIMAIILFTLSASLKERLLYLFSRFNKNAPHKQN